jgi:protein SCO1
MGKKTTWSSTKTRQYDSAVMRVPSERGRCRFITHREQVGSHSGQKQRRPRTGGLVALCAIGLALTLGAVGCQQKSNQLPKGVFGPGTRAYCLPAAHFVDQEGNPVDFASLKGKWLLVDFIYTRCPGPCELMTNRLAHVADQLKTDLGKNVEFVSITLDPEHDGPKQLRDWAQAQDALRTGWLFLTGSLQNVEEVMAPFHVKRRVESNGEIDHVIEVFLVGPIGHERRQYSPYEATPKAIANDVKALAS